MPKRKYFRKIYQNTTKYKFLKNLFKFSVFVFLFLGFASLFLFIYYAKDLPRPEKFTEKQIIQPTKIYDRSGEVLLYEIYGEEKREIISLDQVSENLKNAVIATEDSNFYNHHGIDFFGILRSIKLNIGIGKPTYGASTISQQLIRSSFLTLEKTIKRKIREIILTLELERRYSKKDILGWYLNQVPFGSNAYGVEAASQTYFNKPAKDISLAQSAILASLIQAPSYLSPYGHHKDKLLIRKNYVLDRMVQEKYITKEEAETAKNENLEFAKILQPIKAPHFVLMIKDYLVKKYGENFLKEKGIKVYTTLNWNLQEIAEKAVKQGAETNKAFNANNASLVALDPKTGQILALVGSKDYFADSYPENCISGLNCRFEPKVNIALYGEGRQPGSAFKPIVYAQAFKNGLTPETILWDVKTNFNTGSGKDYIPQNYDGKFRGPISIKKSLAQSLNVPSVKVLYLAGINKTIELAKNMGIKTLTKPTSWYGLSLVLGGGEVKLLDIVSSFGVFASNGLKTSPVSILKIQDYSGNIIEENKKTPKRILESQITSMINSILSDNQARSPMFGLNSYLHIKGYEVAAKTGTTENFKDAWTIGYTPSIVTGVWVGNNDAEEMSEKPGVVLAGPIWKNFMKQALTYYPKENFLKPKPIITEKKILKGEVDLSNPHSILYYIDKKNPLGPMPENPELDPQFKNWEKGIKEWLKS